MPTYNELVSKYKKRQIDNVVDAVSIGLSYADNVAVDLGLLSDCDALTDTLDVVSGFFPFALIAVTEQCKVIMGKKDQKTGLSDTVFRMVKSGAALSVGAVAGVAGGAFVAIPAALGMRSVLDHYKSKGLTASRVSKRVDRLHMLKDLNEKRRLMNQSGQTLLQGDIEYLE